MEIAKSGRMDGAGYSGRSLTDKETKSFGEHRSTDSYDSYGVMHIHIVIMME